MAKQTAAVRRVVTASLIGATIEWYDFFLYGVVAGIVFNKLYFPTDDPLVSTMLAYTTFAVGFITRPLGGLIRPLRRPHRPQEHAGDDADDHGRVDLPDRPGAHLRQHRHLGARAAAALARVPGHRAGRRMGRRGADGL